MADFALQESSKLISRKIWMIEKSWNFHTVHIGFQQFTKLYNKVGNTDRIVEGIYWKIVPESLRDSIFVEPKFFNNQTAETLSTFYWDSKKSIAIQQVWLFPLGFSNWFLIDFSISLINFWILFYVNFLHNFYCFLDSKYSVKITYNLI